ncbi:Frataxin -like protein [Escovopsis weberi]|uniref:ferroxidase n=1 Tax=Escovopsis weberi TaxID=150374 RepID=A0A0M9VWZ4_ESCWE|nr:Frataxin -like protein [Escovopsis weberi]
MASSIISRRCIAHAPRLIRQSTRASSRATAASLPQLTQLPHTTRPALSHRGFSACARPARGIMPDSSAPTTKDSPVTEAKYVAADLSDAEYHEIANRYLEHVLTKFEQLQESREDLDVEFSAGVMTITVADKGTFIINKQPPNKQIWLSSPISGPKRYDWSVVSEGQGDKEGTAAGYWVYLRQGSTLDELILEEIGVDVEDPEDN